MGIVDLRAYFTPAVSTTVSAGLVTGLIAAAMLISTDAAAQRSRRHLVGLDGAATTFRGAAGSRGVAARPVGAPSLRLTLERRSGRLAIGLGAGYLRSPVGIVGPELAVVDREFPLTLYEIAPFVALCAARIGEAASLWVGAGPTVDHWRWGAGEPRTRIGGSAFASIESMLTTRVALAAVARVTLTGSVFNDDDLAESFRRRALTRWEAGLGLRYRLRLQ